MTDDAVGLEQWMAQSDNEVPGIEGNDDEMVGFDGQLPRETRKVDETSDPELTSMAADGRGAAGEDDVARGETHPWLGTRLLETYDRDSCLLALLKEYGCPSRDG